LSDNSRQRFHTLINGQLQTKPVTTMSTAEYRFWQLRALMGSYSHLYQLIRLWWHSAEIESGGRQLEVQVAEQLQIVENDRIKLGWRLTFELLRQIHCIAKQMGSETAVFLIPMSVQLNDESLGGFLQAHHLAKESISLDRCQHMVRDFGKKEDLEVIDLLPRFRQLSCAGKSLVLRRDGHWTEEGHQVAATMVADALLSKMLAVVQSGETSTATQTLASGQSRSAH